MRIRAVETAEDWSAVREIRQRVFVEEQACPPHEEWDAWDAPEARGVTCHHLLGSIEGEPVAVARWRPVGGYGPRAAKLERFAVVPEARGCGLGRAIVAATIREAEAAGYSTLVLHAQAHLAELYASFGFEQAGDRFTEAGIPHVKMMRRSARDEA